MALRALYGLECSASGNGGDGDGGAVTGEMRGVAVVRRCGLRMRLTDVVCGCGCEDHI